MSGSYIDIVRDLIARFFNGHNPDLATEFFTSDLQWNGGSVGSVSGAENYAAVMRQFFAALPDVHATEQEALAAGDKVAMRFIVEGTHTGNLWGVPATGKQAANGTGPQVGSRLVGMVDAGSWAEQVAVPTNRLAELPASVTFAQAATLPVAGLTALRALEKGGLLLTKRALITGSTGGVGLFAHQLARLSGASVVGTARSAHNEVLVREAGADEVIVGDDLEPARAYGPYHLIIESLGGKTLASALSLLATRGTCVTLGWSASPEVAIDVRDLIRVRGTTLYGLSLYDELDRRAGSEDLARLAQLVARQQLEPPIAVEASWHDIGEVAQRLRQRQFTGKALLHLT